ncbi:MAG: efflux RND transporter periplasmic adaptor subunit [Bdellovibrionales bacterium]|nr:efflux RND transporter periplasmic adaptor subunit [Bdellovibrionales bacterium]
MNRNRMRLIIAGIVFVFLIVLITTLNQCSTPKTGKTSQTTIEQIGGHNHKEIWTCPMHPQVRKDQPGQCPICNMSLVKVEGESNTESGAQESGPFPDGHASFELSTQRQQMIGVKASQVEKKNLFKSIEAAGRVAFDPELYTAQSEYLEALRQVSRVQESPIAEVKHSAQRMSESAKLRLKILGLSDDQISALRSSGASGSSLLVPKAGENIWVYAEVYEMDLSSLQPGLEVRVSGGSLGGQVLTGKVASVDRVINPTTRTAKVRIQVPNAKVALRPEAYVDVAILSPLGEQITVPFDAILDTGKQAWVFVIKEPGKFEPRIIKIKFRAGDEVAVSEGLSGGENIVTSANFLIDSESRLKGVSLAQSNEAAGETKKSPDCPKGQFWHAEMKHCMNEPGK